MGAHLLLRPLQAFLAGERPFSTIERDIALLPTRSAMVVAAL
jgi:hypothetical protein